MQAWSRGLRSLATFKLHNARGPVLQSRKIAFNAHSTVRRHIEVTHYIGEGSSSHSKRKGIFIHVFSCEWSVKFDRWA
jgi:hypothetical protein